MKDYLVVRDEDKKLISQTDELVVPPRFVPPALFAKGNEVVAYYVDKAEGERLEREVKTPKAKSDPRKE